MSKTHYITVPFLILVLGCAYESGVTIGDQDGTTTDAAETDPVPWSPPIDDLGSPGWKGSLTPWCHDLRGPCMGYDIWSDARGVFVLVSQMPDYYTEALNRVYLNDGTGWRHFLDHTDPMFPSDGLWHLSGVPSGLLFGHGVYGELASIQSGSLRREGFSAWDLWVVSDHLAYAAVMGALPVSVWDGASWSPLPGDPLPDDVQVVWGDEDSLFIGGREGNMVSYEDGSWIVHDTGTMSDFSAIWGFSGEDVWAGTHDGTLLRYDGSTWSRVEWPSAGDSTDPESCRSAMQGIAGMWGTGHTLFIHTNRQLFKWDGTEFTNIAYWPGEDRTDGEGGHWCEGVVHIGSVWGNSETELFLAVSDEDMDARGPCYNLYLLYWDGIDFHIF